MHVSRRFSSPTWTPSRNIDVIKAQLNVTKSIFPGFDEVSSNFFELVCQENLVSNKFISVKLPSHHTIPIGSPIGRQFPYVDIDCSLFCMLEDSRLISNRRKRVASGISGRPDVQFWKVPSPFGIWSESWRMFQSTSTF